MFVSVFAHTAQSVAAYSGLAAVGVEYAHAVVGHIRGAHSQQAVGSYAEAAAAECAGQLSGFGSVAAHAVDKHEIVAYSVHFYELQFHYSMAFLRRFRPSSSSLRGTPTLRRMNPAPSRPNVVPPLIASNPRFIMRSQSWS